MFAWDGQTVAIRTADGTTGLWFTAPGPQGTPSVQVNASTGAITKRYFTPYGAPRAAVPSWQGISTFLGGTGATADSTTGLVHLGAREYDAVLGRFVSVDPKMDMGDPTQWNGYSYAQQSPINLSDADGQRPLGAGDWGCQNCRPTVKSTGSGKAKTTTKSWTFGNENTYKNQWNEVKYDTSGGPGYKSVWGSAYTGNKYGGGGGHHTDTPYVPKPLNVVQKTIVFGAMNGGPATLLGWVDAGNQIRGGDIQGGAAAAVLALPGLKYLKALKTARAIKKAEKARAAVKDVKLRRALDDDYRPVSDPIGDGSALAAARHTIETGELVGNSTHLEKAVEMRDRYAKALRRGGLSDSEQAVAQGRHDAYQSFVAENDLDGMMKARDR